jgi:hypothetical protein
MLKPIDSTVQGESFESLLPGAIVWKSPERESAGQNVHLTED